MSWSTGSAEVDVLSSQLLDPEDRLLSGKWKHPSQLWEGQPEQSGKEQGLQGHWSVSTTVFCHSHPVTSSQIVVEQALATLEAVDGRPPEYRARCGLCV